MLNKKNDGEKRRASKARRQEQARDIAERGMESPHYVTWIRSLLRRSFRAWPGYLAAWKDVPTKREKAPNRRGILQMQTFHQCAVCQGWFVKRDMNLDHITPAGSMKEATYEAIGRFVSNLMCSKYSLRAVCDYKLSDAEKRFNGRVSCHYRLTHGDLSGKPRKAEPAKDRKKPNKSSNRAAKRKPAE